MPKTREPDTQTHNTHTFKALRSRALILLGPAHIRRPSIRVCINTSAAPTRTHAHPDVHPTVHPTALRRRSCARRRRQSPRERRLRSSAHGRAECLQLLARFLEVFAHALHLHRTCKAICRARACAHALHTVAHAPTPAYAPAYAPAHAYAHAPTPAHAYAPANAHARAWKLKVSSMRSRVCPSIIACCACAKEGSNRPAGRKPGCRVPGAEQRAEQSRGQRAGRQPAGQLLRGARANASVVTSRRTPRPLCTP